MNVKNVQLIVIQLYQIHANVLHVKKITFYLNLDAMNVLMKTYVNHIKMIIANAKIVKVDIIKINIAVINVVINALHVMVI